MGGWGLQGDCRGRAEDMVEGKIAKYKGIIKKTMKIYVL